MDVRKVVAVVLLAAGVLVLVYRGFTYPERHEARVGPIELSVKEEKRVALPTWLGVVLVIAGGGLLLAPSRRA
jgi:hypothetical protein